MRPPHIPCNLGVIASAVAGVKEGGKVKIRKFPHSVWRTFSPAARWIAFQVIFRV